MLIVVILGYSQCGILVFLIYFFPAFPSVIFLMSLQITEAKLNSKHINM